MKFSRLIGNELPSQRWNHTRPGREFNAPNCGALPTVEGGGQEYELVRWRDS
jgi:hypothetical protein